VTPLDQIWDEARSSWRFRWVAFATATAVAVVGWLIVFALPNRYEAAASAFVNTRVPLGEVPTAEWDAAAKLNFVRQSLLAGPTLRRIAREAGAWPPGTVDPQTEQEISAGLRARIEIDEKSPNGREEERNTVGSVYRIVFRDPNRARALRLVTALLNTFVTETLRGKREDSEKAQRVLERQINDCEQRLRAAEGRLAAFRTRHPFPTEPGGYSAQLEREQEKISDLNGKLAEVSSRRANLIEPLHRDPVVAAAQAHLDELRRRFTDNHPDVSAAREELADLEQRRAAEIEARLDRLDIETAHLSYELSEHRSRMAELQQLVATAPQVEMELARLSRDYDANKAQYPRLREELQKARLAPDTVLFEVVEPPTVSARPVWPNRPLLLAESLLAALAAGGALAYGMHYLRPVVTMASALAAGTPVLGLVSVAFPDRARKATRCDVLQFSLAGGCLVVGFVAVLILSLQGYHLSVTALKQMLHS